MDGVIRQRPGSVVQARISVLLGIVMVATSSCGNERRSEAGVATSSSVKAPSQVLQEDERLTRTRNVFIVGAIDDHAANVAIASILFLRHEDERPFTVTLDSPGGVVTSTLAIVDVLRERRASSRTTCVGKAEGVAALILACGALGHRRIARSGTVWIGPVERPEGRVGVEDVLRRMDDVTLDLLVECTGRAREPLREMVAARRRLDAGEAVRYGFADEVF